uniref:Nonsense-mediated mRNA decay factor SMG8 n=1 Tax=Mesocestoides corti TaxID=53468 RepID=A0A5K3FDH5_MESCO
MSTYCGGRFAVPPGFDFRYLVFLILLFLRLLPQKSKSVVVVSIIGFFDSFRQMTSSSLVENFLNRNAFSLPCTDVHSRYSLYNYNFYRVSFKVIMIVNTN